MARSDADQTYQIVPSLPLASGRITLPGALQLGSAAAAAAATTAAGRWGAIQLWEHPPLQYEPGGARLVLFEGLDELLAKLPVLGIFSVSGGILEPHWGDFRMIAGWLVPSGLRAPAQHVVYRQLWLCFHPTLLILLT
jgi:hypothetical protein